MFESKESKELKKTSSIVEDYISGITNFRVLAKKHDKTLKQIASYLKSQINK